MTTSIALLGTGLLGSAFAEAFLARGGVSLAVWNRTKQKAEPLAALGARVAESPADAVRNAKIVHLVLLDDETVDETIAAMLPSLPRGAVIVDHTTLRPDLVAARAASLDSSGVEYLHCPVMMGPPAARKAGGVMFAAGPVERFARVKDHLASMTADLWYVGERADLAAAYKLCSNAMLLGLTGVLADILHMTDELHVNRGDILDLFKRVKADSFMSARGLRMVNADYEATFTLVTARKDARLMIESAGAQPMPILRALAARMDEAIAAGDGDLDMGIIGKPSQN